MIAVIMINPAIWPPARLRGRKPAFLPTLPIPDTFTLLIRPATVRLQAMQLPLPNLARRLLPMLPVTNQLPPGTTLLLLYSLTALAVGLGVGLNIFATSGIILQLIPGQGQKLNGQAGL